MEEPKEPKIKVLTKEEMLASLHSSEGSAPSSLPDEVAEKSEKQIQEAEEKESKEILHRLKHELRGFFGKEIDTIEDDGESLLDWQETLRIHKENLVEIQTVAVHNALAKVLGLVKK